VRQILFFIKSLAPERDNSLSLTARCGILAVAAIMELSSRRR